MNTKSTIRKKSRANPSQPVPTRSDLPRVLIFMEAYRVGGPAKNLIAFIKAAQGQAEIGVCTFLRQPMQKSDFSEALGKLNIALYVIDEQRRWDLAGLAKIYAAIKDFSPQILQVHNQKSRLYAKVLKNIGALKGVSQIDCFHGETWVDAKQEAYNKVDRYFFKRAKHILCVSESQRSLLEGWDLKAQNIQVIPNAIKNPAPVQTKPRGESIHFLSVGRLSKEKGHALLLRAFHQVNQTHHNIHLTLVGNGPETAELEQIIGLMGLGNSVTLSGYQNDTEPYYKKADCFILPSFSEGMPNVLLEAAMYKVPIISTEVGGVKEVTLEHALLIPAQEVEALSQAMEAFIQQPEQASQRAEAAYAHVKQTFGHQRRTERFLAFYKSLIE